MGHVEEQNLTRTIIQWEEVTGKSYRALNYAEREQANNEIKAMKAVEAADGRRTAGGRGR